MTTIAKSQADKDQHKRDRFKALKMPRVNALVQKHKQLANLSNRSNYKFTEGEAELIVKLYEKITWGRSGKMAKPWFFQS